MFQMSPSLWLVIFFIETAMICWMNLSTYFVSEFLTWVYSKFSQIKGDLMWGYGI